MSGRKTPGGNALPTWAARAVGRFRPEGALGYRAESGGPLRATRAEAEADEARTIDARWAEPSPVLDLEPLQDRHYLFGGSVQ